jgi:hypothetical protein
MKNTRNTRKRKNQQSWYTDNQGKTVAHLPPTIVPDVAHTVLKFRQRLVPTPASGAAYHQVFSGNGLYDPDITGSGAQPMGFDQWMNLYAYYRSTKSIITIDVRDNAGTAASTQAEWCLIPTALSSDLAAYDPMTAAELPYSRFGTSGTHTGGGARFSLTNTMSMSKMYGLDDMRFGVNALGTESANPSSQFNWHILGQVIDEATTMANTYIYVEIRYWVTFSRRVALAQS